MRGNVAEWVQDFYDPNYYSSSPAADPKDLGRDLRWQNEDGAADDLVDTDRSEVPLAEFAPQLNGWNRGDD